MSGKEINKSGDFDLEGGAVFLYIDIGGTKFRLFFFRRSLFIDFTL